MTTRRAALGLLAAAACGAGWAQTPAWPPTVRQDWTEVFAREGAVGTFVLWRTGAPVPEVHDAVRAQRRLPPASTFKLPHALAALDEGVVRDENETFAWDGKTRSIPAWNRSQTLAQAMKHSTVWVFQEIARRLGPALEQAWLDRLGYGNRDMTGGLEQFWLTGGLRLSAVEQATLMARLRTLSAPATERSQRIVRHMALLEAARSFALFGKTGWADARDDGGAATGWLVGWVDREEKSAAFALNMDVRDLKTDPPRRLALAREVLRLDGWLSPT